MFGRLKILSELYATGRLALGLFRDSRVPMASKLVLGAAALYLVSPIDIAPDWFPMIGQADDILVLLAGLNLFIKACPRWLVDEHRRRVGPKDGRRERSGESVVEGQYRVVE